MFRVVRLIVQSGTVLIRRETRDEEALLVNSDLVRTYDIADHVDHGGFVRCTLSLSGCLRLPHNLRLHLLVHT